MSEIRIKDNESLESALRRFKRSVRDDPAFWQRFVRENTTRSLL